MTLEELVGLMFEANKGGMEATTLYLSFLSAYLLVAYLAGRNLSSFQVYLTSFLFIVFSGFFALGSYRFFESAHALSLAQGPALNVEVQPLALAYGILGAEVIGIFGSLYFMFDVRRKAGT